MGKTVQITSVKQLMIYYGIALGPSPSSGAVIVCGYRLHMTPDIRTVSGVYLRLYLTRGALTHRRPIDRALPASPAVSAFVSRLSAVLPAGVYVLILLGFPGVSAFVSHPSFGPAAAFDTPDEPLSMPLRPDTDP
jgi:hypothetical protein